MEEGEIPKTDHRRADQVRDGDHVRRGGEEEAVEVGRASSNETSRQVTGIKGKVKRMESVDFEEVMYNTEAIKHVDEEDRVSLQRMSLRQFVFYIWETRRLPLEVKGEQKHRARASKV